MKYIIFILIFFYPLNIFASSKQLIKDKLEETENISFKFIQKIGKKTEQGECIISYPKKILCKYDDIYNKILVSNGRSLVIKTENSYYIYPIDKTPLSLILDKKFLLKKVNDLEERIIDNKFINYNFFENENEINLFFDRKTFNLIGWQTVDIYQNLSITYLSTIIKNQELDRNLFNLPERN